MPIRILRFAALLAAPLAAGAASLVLSASTPSTDFGGYVLFASDHLGSRGVTVVDGDLGVNDGDLEVRRDLEAPHSQVATGTVTFISPVGACHIEQLFANQGTTPCGSSTPFAPPVLGPGFFDLGRACGFPTTPIQCGAPTGILVGPGETTTIPPGTYGDVTLRSAAGATATLVLQGGEYTFCSLRTSPDTRVVFNAAATVRVANEIHLGDRTILGPGAAGPAARDVRVFLAGQKLSFRQRVEAHARFCAPAGGAHLGPRVTLEGQLAARTIRLDRDVVAGLSGTLGGSSTTTVTTTSTSTSTIPLGCGNHVREGSEVCDAPDFGHATCPGSSTGACLRCLDGCSRIDFNGCPGAASSTSSTTSTSTSSSTSIPRSTIPAPRCGDGIVNGNEVCDPPDFGSGGRCPAGSPPGAVPGCSADCMRIDTTGCSTTATELCGNCIDDDGNGLTDFEDPACCVQVRTFRMTLSRARLVPGAGTSRLTLQSILARAGLTRVDPRVQDVLFQLKPANGTDVLCARVPANRFAAKGHVFRFVDKQATVESARGLSAMTVRIRPDGSVRFVAHGKQVRLGATQPGSLQVTVGFLSRGGPAGDSRCSTTTQSFRGNRKGSLLAP